VEDRARALSAGFNMFVPKPVEPSELITAIANLTVLWVSRSETARDTAGEFSPGPTNFSLSLVSAIHPLPKPRQT